MVIVCWSTANRFSNNAPLTKDEFKDGYSLTHTGSPQCRNTKESDRTVLYGGECCFKTMIIRTGFEAAFDFAKPTPVLLMAYVHPSRASTIRRLEPLTVNPPSAIVEYTDAYGNRCGRVVVPAGRVAFRNDAIVEDDGLPDPQVWNAPQHHVQDLPDDVLLFLLASRYCEVDSELKEIAWTLFGDNRPAGRGCRRSAISSNSTFASITNRPAPIEPRRKSIANGPASAATTCIWPSRFAAA